VSVRYDDREGGRVHRRATIRAHPRGASLPQPVPAPVKPRVLFGRCPRCGTPLWPLEERCGYCNGGFARWREAA
jgi:uncharacterized OB-fold protein